MHRPTGKWCTKSQMWERKLTFFWGWTAAQLNKSRGTGWCLRAQSLYREGDTFSHIQCMEWMYSYHHLRERVLTFLDHKPCRPCMYTSFWYNIKEKKCNFLDGTFVDHQQCIDLSLQYKSEEMKCCRDQCVSVLIFHPFYLLPDCLTVIPSLWTLFSC